MRTALQKLIVKEHKQQSLQWGECEEVKFLPTEATDSQIFFFGGGCSVTGSSQIQPYEVMEKRLGFCFFSPKKLQMIVSSCSAFCFRERHFTIKSVSFASIQACFSLLTLFSFTTLPLFLPWYHGFVYSVKIKREFCIVNM